MDNQASNSPTWQNLPDDATLEQMSSAALLDLQQALQNQEPADAPAQAIEWLMQQVPGISMEDAIDMLQGTVRSRRSQYTHRLYDMAQAKYADGPERASKEEAYRDLAARQSRLSLSVELGLRSDEEVRWISTRHNDIRGAEMSEHEFRSCIYSAIRQHELNQRLASWKSKIDDIESNLAVIDPDVLRPRLDEEISKPFNPSKGEISKTLHEMGDWMSPVNNLDAVDNLKRAHAERMAALQAWREHLDTAQATQAPPTAASKPRP